jgi:hypothetical protein
MRQLIARGYKAQPNGSVPGHVFHDIEATIYAVPDGYQVTLREEWGSNQGYREIHGDRDVSACAASVVAAVGVALDRARDACMRMDLAVQAVSLAETDWLDSDTETDATA